MSEPRLKYVAQYDKLSLPAIQRLECWMQEVTDLLCYQPEIPMAHKTEICNALHHFRMELGPPKEDDQLASARDALASRLRNYLETGGLINPEMMEHEKVRDLLMECQHFLISYENH